MPNHHCDVIWQKAHHHCDVPFERHFDRLNGSLNETIALRVFRTTGDVFKIPVLCKFAVFMGNELWPVVSNNLLRNTKF